jgi:hypothetical protein
MRCTPGNAAGEERGCTMVVVSRQSSPHFAGAPSHRARNPLPFCSPSLHLNLTYPHRPPLCALYRLNSAHPSCLGVLIPGRAAVESVNSWREGFRRARTGSRGAVMAPGIRVSSRAHYPGVEYQYYYRGRVRILPCNLLLILLSAAILSLKFSSLARSPCCSSRLFRSSKTKYVCIYVRYVADSFGKEPHGMRLTQSREWPGFELLTETEVEE